MSNVCKDGVSRIGELIAFAVVFYVLSVAVPKVYAQDPLTTIESIRKLPVDKAEKNPPVLVDAQVVFVNPYRGDFFLYDGENGIYVRGNEAKELSKTFKGGELVRVEGVAGPGGFAPDITANRITVQGRDARPEGGIVFPNLRHSPSSDGKWVKTHGRLTSMNVYGIDQSILLEVNRNDVFEKVYMPYSESNEKRLAELMFEYVEFSAVYGTVFNDQRQFVGRILYVNSADDFALTMNQKKRNSDNIALMKIHHLYRFTDWPRRELKIQGRVLCVGSREIFIRGEQASIKVVVPASPQVNVGDDVMVEGVVWSQSVTPAFRARSVQLIGKGEVPTPIRMVPKDKINSVYNYNLININADLVDVGKQFMGVDGALQSIWLCRAAGELFEVFFPPGHIIENDIKPGAKLLLTGICNVSRNPNMSWYVSTDGFSLQLRSKDDVVVLSQPSWWTIERLFGMLGLVLSVLALFAIWVGLLNRTVKRQTGVIREKIELESVLNERQRIARELHDNLAQGLVGMAIHLQGCFRMLELGKNKLKGLVVSAEASGDFTPLMEGVEGQAVEENNFLQLMQEMLDQCSEESRSSILYLRSGRSGRMGLLSALEEVLESLAQEAGAFLEILVVGDAQALPMDVERNIMLLVKEAVTNAVRHGKAEGIVVRLIYSENTLVVRVKDNGCGFMSEVPVNKGHYGIKGMEERAELLGGNLQVESHPGNGTEIILNLSIIKDEGHEHDG